MVYFLLCDRYTVTLPYEENITFHRTDFNCLHNIISAQRGTRDTLKVGKDSTEYELIIFDPEFEGWLSAKPSMNYHSNEFYRQRNIRYVQEWKPLQESRQIWRRV